MKTHTHTDQPVPTSDEVVAARYYCQMMVAASKRGDKTYEQAKEACERYIDLAHRRQLALYGKIKAKLTLGWLMR